ncbi:MAG: glycosyltransferase [Ignavibacteriales bacterium]|nr:MAG: glycosyltransferase [Ignavibacteriales bacterium]
MNISVIIPAYNAGDTISDTIRSIQNQTHTGWEIIIVDDGSVDNTSSIVKKFCEKENRIRFIQAQHKGAGAARNIGIKNANYDWLLFLDADDWIAKNHLQLLIDRYKSDPTLDIVYSNWVRVNPEGKTFSEHNFSREGNLFDVFTRTCAISIHSCIVRKSTVVNLGGFDTELITCEDWDLWQRMARTGSKFGAVKEQLAFYRMRSASASNDGMQMLKDSLKVIERGHSFDERVKHPMAEHKDGRSAENINFIKLHSACWSIGLAIGNDKDYKPLLKLLGNICCPSLDPKGIADTLFNSILLPKCKLPEEWLNIFPSVEKQINSFLFELERISCAKDLHKRTILVLIRNILSHTTATERISLNNFSSLHIDVTKNINDLYFDNGTERVCLNIFYGGNSIGQTFLPVFNNFIPKEIIEDAISDEFSWEILFYFFNEEIYKQVSHYIKDGKLYVNRNNRLIGKFNFDGESIEIEVLHDFIGWTIFLQELWGLDEWTSDDFYREKSIKNTGTTIKAFDKIIMLEISEPLPKIDSAHDNLNIAVAVGGEVIGLVNIETANGIIQPGRLCTKININTGYELCRAAVRNGIIGKEFLSGFSLRKRLASVNNNQTEITRSFASNEIILKEKDSKNNNKYLIPRRFPFSFGYSSSRKGMLPKEALNVINKQSDTGSSITAEVNKTEAVIYNPELIVLENGRNNPEILKHEHQPISDDEGNETYDKSYFENLFLQKEDPWNYTSEYERIKYEQTLSLLPEREIETALEIGCAEGTFTKMLAPKVKNLVASDISPTAIERSEQYCSDQNNIRFTLLDVYKENIPGRFDVIICSEVLYYLDGVKELSIVAKKIADALNPNGVLIMAHANVIVDDPDKTGFDWNVKYGAKVIGKTFAAQRHLSIKKEIRTPLYRVQQFTKEKFFNKIIPRKRTVIELPMHAELTPDIAEQISWEDKNSDHIKGENIFSSTLPILMYHRIHPTGSGNLTQFRINPEIFREQIKYLRDNGYYSISFEDWMDASFKKESLPGKPVILTFDDGYKDFMQYAFPVLKEFGFKAYVFIVTDKIGKTNSWDSNYGEEVELLNWNDITELSKNGIEFGAHSHSHPMLTALSPTDAALELIKSREILSQKSGKPIYSMAYPYGDFDKIVSHLAGAAGFLFSVTCEMRKCNFNDNFLSLPRIEITGTDTLDNFIAKLKLE